MEYDDENSFSQIQELLGLSDRLRLRLEKDVGKGVDSLRGNDEIFKQINCSKCKKLFPVRAEDIKNNKQIQCPSCFSGLTVGR